MEHVIRGSNFHYTQPILRQRQKTVTDSDPANLDIRPRPLRDIAKIGKTRKSACEDRRDFSDTPKCAQWPHLYKSYEATYTSKCLVFVKITKNRILCMRVA